MKPQPRWTGASATCPRAQGRRGTGPTMAVATAASASCRSSGSLCARGEKVRQRRFCATGASRWAQRDGTRRGEARRHGTARCEPECAVGCGERRACATPRATASSVCRDATAHWPPTVRSASSATFPCFSSQARRSSILCSSAWGLPICVLIIFRNAALRALPGAGTCAKSNTCGIRWPDRGWFWRRCVATVWTGHLDAP